MQPQSPKLSPSEGRCSLLFQPTPDQISRMTDFANDRKPTYLFRVFSPNSVGSTSETMVIPPGSVEIENDPAQDFFKMQEDEAAWSLNAHLRWWSSHEHSCKLVSWTSSLLFALQYGFYKHNSKKDGSALSEIFLLVLDTSSFKKGTFIKDLDAIRCFTSTSNPTTYDNLLDFLWLRTKQPAGNRYYFGEYLSQGRLDISGACAVTSFQSMEKAELFKVCKELGEKGCWDKWANRIVDLRKRFFQAATHLTTLVEVNRAVTLAGKCFGSEWTLPIAAMLLSFRERSERDIMILKGLSGVASRTELRKFLQQGITVIADRQPELVQFDMIVNELREHIDEDEAEALITSMNDMGLAEQSELLAEN